jgi:hypothetical protein
LGQGADRRLGLNLDCHLGDWERSEDVRSHTVEHGRP